MAKIHMVLQGKGGVGKSMIAATIAQYKAGKGQKPLCIDTDPVNATFEGYKALNVRRLNIMDGDEINTRNFDALVEMIASAEGDVIIDNGASSFVPLSHYLISNQVPALLQDMGHELVVHTVVTGGQALVDTVSGFAQLASQFPAECLFVVWLNPYWGPIEHEGKGFEQLKAYTANKGRVPVPWGTSIGSLSLLCYICYTRVAPHTAMSSARRCRLSPSLCNCCHCSRSCCSGAPASSVCHCV